MKGREALLKGAKWTVRNGKSIGVWLYSWLPSPDRPRILSPIVESFEETRVVDLIEPESGQWDLNLLQGLFIPSSAEMIRSIPLCSAAVEDKLIWPHTPLGQYSMQSRYRFLMRESSNYQTLERPNASGGLWKIIWNLSVPNKVRNFLWRSCKDALPVKANLVKRRILQSANCDHCNGEPEDVLHALWKCSAIS